MSFKKYRSNLSIIVDILSAIKEEGRIGKSRIMQKANLSYDRLGPRIEELLRRGLIEEVIDENKVLYQLTEKGYTFLNEYQKMKAFLDAFGLEV
ncbi:MAG: winged helix-turn-helix domain-containing protein [Thermoproteota archaeon]|nr:hypothetical protein [Candidatus Brockarchaeota archaeon]MBO3762954.1 hypothetical protein [Candidatus Brockarchaeota archaeon]MBO3768261.1 hypothetical protein [Candidatus Brockarchaeota archaeon]MBO3802118.1 hypothetical protein [Candidatus Brockarchaeota archaeon]